MAWWWLWIGGRPTGWARCTGQSRSSWLRPPPPPRRSKPSKTWPRPARAQPKSADVVRFRPRLPQLCQKSFKHQSNSAQMWSLRPNIGRCLSHFGQVWPTPVLMPNMHRFGPNRPKCGQVRAILASVGHFQSTVSKVGRIWTETDRCRALSTFIARVCAPLVPERGLSSSRDADCADFRRN